MDRRRAVLALLAGILFSAPAHSAEFSIGFDWGGLKKCTSGNPNTVPSPRFTVKGAPAGTVAIQFRMVDLNVPSYPHGGGKAAYGGGGSVPAGAFRYKSPCPPDGRHTYQWTATALDGGGKKLATARAQKPYP